ncbi:MAG: hypothetical protein ABSG45_05830 [Nitrososphaerales archaeon]
MAIFLLDKTVTGTTPAAIQAAIAGGLLTAMGTIFSAVYKEVSAYFQQTTSNVNAKVTMISPIVQKYYSPWINSAQILHGKLESLTKSDAAAPEDIQTLLYYIMVYYGYRMKFILEAGGLILLSSTAQQNIVHDAYRAAEVALDWEGAKTHGDVSYLQTLFLTKNPATGSDQTKTGGSSSAPGAPYMFFQFSKDIPGDRTLSSMTDSLTQWVGQKDKVKAASAAVDNFALTFQTSIDQLYTAWGQ